MSNHNGAKASACSRRTFLKSAGLIAGAAATAQLTVGRAAHAAGSDVVKFGLIGCGGRGSGAAMNAMDADPGAKLIAMADLFQDKVVGSRDRLKQGKPEQVDVPDDRCFHGFDAYQKVIASDAQVILIACTSCFHPLYLQAAVAAGKHVFLEKPHSTDVPGLFVVKAACEEAAKKNLSVVSGLCWRYHTGVRETMKRVLDGAIGEIVAIQETYMRTPYRLVERSADQTELQYQFRNWYHFNWLSGDDILQSLVHSLDKGAWAMHDQPPVKAYGVGGRSSSWDKPYVYGDVFDHSSVVYEYANGVRLYGVGRAQNGCYNEVSDVLMGSKGRCNLIKHQIEGATNWEYTGPKCNMTEEEQRELFQAVRAGKPINNGNYMFNSTMIGILGRMVCFTGQEVTWDDALKSTYQIGPTDPTWDMQPPVKPNEEGVYPVAIPGVTAQA
ncbi:MAG: Gfo/Idh/MocA family oxidoreductase [Rhodopirellula sp.]|nr:Gfo/Idh/MocA family oxidoreductase [Rhodopirellula sp.]